MGERKTELEKDRLRRVKKPKNSKNPYDENLDELKQLIREGLSKNELLERNFSQYIVERHYDLTINRLKKSNIDIEILENEIREKVYNGHSAGDLHKEGYPNNLISKHYYNVLRIKTQEIRMQSNYRGVRI